MYLWYSRFLVHSLPGAVTVTNVTHTHNTPTPPTTGPCLYYASITNILHTTEVSGIVGYFTQVKPKLLKPTNV